MKTRNQIAFLVLVVINGWLLASVGVAVARDKIMLERTIIDPPILGYMGPSIWHFWPIAGLLISIWGLAEAYRGKWKEEILTNLFLAIIFVEMILAGLYIMGLYKVSMF